MNEPAAKPCADLYEVSHHRHTGYLLSLLHGVTEDQPELRRVSLNTLLSDVALLRRAITLFFERKPNFATPEITAACAHVESLVERGLPLPPPLSFEPLPVHAGQAPIPDSILKLSSLPQMPEYRGLIARTGFEPERGSDTQHSRVFDRALIGHQESNYTLYHPLLGPRPDCADLLRQTPCLLSGFGEFVREHFAGMQLVDVAAGTGEGIAAWAELFGARACIYIDAEYSQSTHQKRGAMDFYRVKGDALHIVSHLPEGIGSFHVSGLELLPTYETRFDGRPYLAALAREMFKKAPSGGLLFVGRLQCSLTDDIVRAAGFEPVAIPNLGRGSEMFPRTTWENQYKVYRKLA